MKKALQKLSTAEFLTILKKTKNDNETAVLLRARCATDFEMFCGVFFPHYANLPFCYMHRNQFKDYKFGERGVYRVDAAPRGYAKSTIKSLFRPIWDICYRQERYIIIASNTEDQAVQKLKDIRNELLTNDFLISVFGKFFSSSVVSKRSFVVRSGSFEALLEAAGSSKELRGKRFREHRPTKIVIDDFEHSTEVESEAVREKTKKLFYDVFTKLGNKKTNIDVVGTVLHRQSLLKDLLENPGYRRNTYKAIESWSEREDLWKEWQTIYTDLDNRFNDRDAQKFYEKNKKELLKGTKVLWPEHESYLDLQKEIVRYGRRTFMKEKQNSPISDDEKIFFWEEMKFFTDMGDHLLIDHNNVKVPKADCIFMGVMDPATGKVKPKINKKVDFTCILTGLVDPLGRLFVLHDFTRRVRPSDYIDVMLNYHEEYGYSKFGVEINLYRELLVPNIRDAWRRRNKTDEIGHDLPILQIENLAKKEQRIYTIEPKVQFGKILFNRTLTREFFDQLLDFPKGDHDDGPDALEMLWSMSSRPAVGGIKI